MEGILNQTNNGKESCILRPDENGQWEVWSVGGDRKRLVRCCAVPGEAQASPQSVLALPARQIFSVPLWLTTTDPALMREMIFLQLERRGLVAGRSAGEIIFDYRVVASNENKTQVLVVVLPGDLPASLCPELRNFEPSARTQPLPNNAFILWREDNRLVLAVTRGAHLAYFQALGEASLTEPVLQELLCIKLHLEAVNMIGRLEGFTLWGRFTPQEVSMVRKTLEIPGQNQPRPDPLPPAEGMDLTPAPVRRAQQLETAKKRKRTLVSAAAGVYLVLVVFLVLRTGWFYLQCRWIGDDLRKHAVEVKEIETTARRWDALSAAINPDSYPVEQLFRCQRLLPFQGVRFTLFKTTGDSILIQGEARDAASAFKFAEDLKQSEDLRDYRWEMPQPKFQNNNAEFQIEGTRYGAKTK
jgi:hypothetical protein